MQGVWQVLGVMEGERNCVHKMVSGRCSKDIKVPTGVKGQCERHSCTRITVSQSSIVNKFRARTIIYIDGLTIAP